MCMSDPSKNQERKRKNKTQSADDHLLERNVELVLHVYIDEYLEL